MAEFQWEGGEKRGRKHLWPFVRCATVCLDKQTNLTKNLNYNIQSPKGVPETSPQNPKPLCRYAAKK